MTKKKKNKIRNAVIIGVIVIILGQITAVGVYGSSWAEKIIQVAGKTYGELLYGDTKGQIDFSDVEEESLGGVLSEKWVKQGNRVSYIESGTFYDASTTLVAFTNPFGVPTSTDAAWNEAAWGTVGTTATSTVVSGNLDISTAATSSIQITCGASVDMWSAPTYDLMSFKVTTGTIGVYNNNQATTSSGLATAAGTGSRVNILLTHDYSYLVCMATGTPEAIGLWGTASQSGGYRRGLTGDNNTFDGTWSFEVIKNLQ